MKVVVTHTAADNWYKVGEVHDVDPNIKHFNGLTHYDYYAIKDNENLHIDVCDCRVVGGDVPPETYIVGLQCNEYRVIGTEADKLAARIEAANTMAAKMPEKTLWDELSPWDLYALAAMTGIMARNDLPPDMDGKVKMVVAYANLMMEARKNK